MAEMTQLTQDVEHNRTAAGSNTDHSYAVRETDTQAQPLTLDQLDYLADLVAELREMSGRAGLTTLAAILALAQTEASAQIAQARSRHLHG